MSPLTSDRGRLRMVFSYRGKRCTEYLDEPDTRENRQARRQWVREFEAALHRADFDYAAWFPRSKRAAKFSPPKPVIPTLGDYFLRWLGTLEISKATLADYKVLKSVFLDRTEVNHRGGLESRGTVARGDVGPRGVADHAALRYGRANQTSRCEDRQDTSSLGSRWVTAVTAKHSPVERTMTVRGRPIGEVGRYSSDAAALSTNSLGAKLITEVTATDIREAIKPHVAAGRIRRPIMFLQRMKAMFRAAIEDGIVERNPSISIQNPKSRRRVEPVEPLSHGEQARLLQVADGQAYNLIVLLVGTGIGPGEAGALRRKDIDLKRRRMSIGGSYGRFGEGPTKTTSRTRIIELNDRVAPVIAALKSQTEASNDGSHLRDAADIRVVHGNLHRLRDGGNNSPDRPLFVGQRGGHLNFTWWRRAVWTPLLAAAKVKYRSPYALRHTFAVRMLELGYDPVTVARQMGHTSTEMVHSIYGRWTNAPEKEQAK